MHELKNAVCGEWFFLGQKISKFDDRSWKRLETMESWGEQHGQESPSHLWFSCFLTDKILYRNSHYCCPCLYVNIFIFQLKSSLICHIAKVILWNGIVGFLNICRKEYMTNFQSYLLIPWLKNILMAKQFCLSGSSV